MRDLWIVASYTIKDMLKKKTFIISNLVIFLIIIVGFNVPNILNMFNEDESSENGSAFIFEGSLETLNTMNLGTEFEITNEEISIDEVKNKIVNGDVDDAIIINESDNKVNVEYIVKNMAMMNNEVPEKVTNMLTSVYTNLQISKLGLTQEQLASLTCKSYTKLYF